MKRNFASFACAALVVGCLAPLFSTAAFADTCVWRGTAPICDGSCRTGEIKKGSASSNAGGGTLTATYAGFGAACTLGGTKALCCTVTPVQGTPPAAQAQPCPSGYVWRDNFDGDTLCVKPEQRHKLADGTCRSGYVWRDTFNGDAVCVTPAERTAAKAAIANKPVKATGKSDAQCSGYAARMIARLNEARSLNCAFLNGSGGWNEPQDYWQAQCAKFSASTLKVNEDGLQRNVDQCKIAAGGGAGGGGGGGGGETATAPGGTTIYKQPNGDDSQANIAGYVDAGGKVTIVTCQDNFCKVSKPKTGWVWHEDIGR